ncbi:uncharacterized protein PHALS_12445 [Plasmopara halstedii]|uniref:Uncharacterized protein n=1 Tax=Plasmopara halstedii TaxID=4781 RepID=A0A0P1AM67_PLAHL|nr:uncharacterized protein PHALS_12445 [Plasmopara halstedii]CEG42146.1 hypothetical protein PHALS_12445 [Plasmopara halstedii]|eukprot:XP_024578515.1 hypothetical protein PHALS_12445 [Plasmopara halstedii]
MGATLLVLDGFIASSSAKTVKCVLVPVFSPTLELSTKYFTSTLAFLVIFFVILSLRVTNHVHLPQRDAFAKHYISRNLISLCDIKSDCFLGSWNRLCYESAQKRVGLATVEYKMIPLDHLFHRRYQIIYFQLKPPEPFVRIACTYFALGIPTLLIRNGVPIERGRTWHQTINSRVPPQLLLHLNESAPGKFKCRTRFARGNPVVHPTVTAHFTILHRMSQ